MIAVSLRRPVTVTMVVAGLLVFGVISYLELGRDLLPDIAYPSLTVSTKYEGAAPQEVEEFVTKKLESALATVKGKRKISSISREGISLITIEFQWGEDMQLAILNVREKLDQARFRVDYPEDADRPNILRWDPSSKPIVGLAITGRGRLLDLKEGVREVIKPRLEQLDGVAYAQITGDIERVIDVEVDRNSLTLYNITMDQIKNAINFANQNLPGGTIKKGRYRYSLRTLGEFASVDEINKVVVTRKGGVDILVSDVAVVNDTIKDRESMATVNGQEAIGLLVYKEAGANTIEATQRIKELLNEFKKDNSDFKITLAFEEAKFIEQALNNVWLSLLFGGMFAFFVLVLFLGDLKSPIFIFISIPIAIISTLVCMYFADISLNIMSLGGLALGVGMLVDNSIVVLENIYRFRQNGTAPMEAAFEGTKEVAAPVAASTLTTIAVFFPIIYLEGIAGALFGEQALTVTFSMVCSLLVSLTVLPLLTALATILEGRDTTAANIMAMPRLEAKIHPRDWWFWSWWEYLICVLLVFFVAAYFKLEWKWSLAILGGVAVLPVVLFFVKWILTFGLSFLFQLFAVLVNLFKSGIQWVLDRLILPVFNAFYHGFEKVYHAVLVFCLNRKFFALILVLGLLGVSVIVGLKLKRELMPKSATGQFSIEAKLPPGTSIEVTEAVIEDFERMLLTDDAVEVVFSQIGASEANLSQLLKDSGTNTAQISVKLKDSHVSLNEVYRLSDLVREKAVDVPGMKVSFQESESSFEDLLASEGGSGLVVQLEGEQFETLYEANDAVVAALLEVPGIKDVKTTLVKDYPQMEVQLNRDNIERYGFSLSQVGNYLSGGMRGSLATDYKEFDRNIDVRVRFQEKDRDNFNVILGTTLTSGEGTPVPLSELLNVEVIKGAKEIRRVNQRRVAVISANLSGKKISEVVPLVNAAFADLSLPAGVAGPYLVGEQEGITHSFGQLGFAFLLSAVLVYMIMAGQFESLKNPFVVIFTVPMGLIGTAFMLYIFDQSINIMSLIGLIVLSGIVVNDAIVKIDFIDQARREGASVRDAIMQASRVRLRPILMTTATTVLGLLPMASGVVPWLVKLPFMGDILAEMDVLMMDWGFSPISPMFSAQGSEIQRPLALVIIGGLTMATMLTLILIPLFYEMLAGKAAEQSQPAEIGGQADQQPSAGEPS